MSLVLFQYSVNKNLSCINAKTFKKENKNMKILEKTDSKLYIKGRFFFTLMFCLEYIIYILPLRITSTKKSFQRLK